MRYAGSCSAGGRAGNLRSSAQILNILTRKEHVQRMEEAENEFKESKLAYKLFHFIGRQNLPPRCRPSWSLGS